MSPLAALTPPPPSSAPTSGAAPPGSPAPPGGAPFHGALAELWARTANAEGQQQEGPEQDGGSSSPTHERPRQGEKAPHAATGGADAAALTPSGAPAQEAAAAAAAATASAPTDARFDVRGSGVAASPSARAGEAVSSLAEGTPSTLEHDRGADGRQNVSVPAKTPAGNAVTGQPGRSTPPGTAGLTGERLPSALAPSPRASVQAAQAATSQPPAASQAHPSSQAAANGRAPSTAPEPASAQALTGVQKGAASGAASPLAPAGAGQAAGPPTTTAAAFRAPASGSVAQTAQATPTVVAGGAEARPSLPTGGAPAQDGGGQGRGRPQGSATMQAASAGSPHGAGGGATASSTGPLGDLFAPRGAAGASATQVSLPSGSGVDLQQMIESVRATIELAARQGVTQARIALQPEELGDIRIHLSQTADGLLARLTADTPAAAASLAEGRRELHQSLSSLGVSLLRLDIGSPAQPEAGDREGRFAGSSDVSAGARESKAPDEAETSATAIELEGVGARAGLQSGGALVDVLA